MKIQFVGGPLDGAVFDSPIMLDSIAVITDGRDPADRTAHYYAATQISHCKAHGTRCRDHPMTVFMSRTSAEYITEDLQGVKLQRG